MNYWCIKCCIKTRMPLSLSDIDRITKMGHRLKDFATKTDNEWRLKNRNGRCVFVSDQGCKIYSYRPEGCQLYPLIYDENLKKAVIDPLCPHGNEFKFKKEDIEKLISLLEKLGKEANE
ncbi:MAG: YkgJ family cysteine cluster protein [Candidatus Bathyarchaeia archaeon]